MEINVSVQYNGGLLPDIISLDCCLLLSICVSFRCVLHPLPLPLSSCLGCIPPLIGLPSLRFYAVGSSLFLLSCVFLFMFSILSRRCPLLATFRDNKRKY